MQQSYPSQYVLSGPSLIREYDPQLIQESLLWLREDAFRITVTSQLLPGGVQTTQTERWYGTEYEVLEVSDTLKASLKNLDLHLALSLPGNNDFIPQNFETHKYEVVKPLSKPSLILHTPTVRMWHKKDDTFWIPRANVWILFRSPLAYATPGNCVKTRFFFFFFLFWFYVSLRARRRSCCREVRGRSRIIFAVNTFNTTKPNTFLRKLYMFPLVFMT